MALSLPTMFDLLIPPGRIPRCSFRHQSDERTSADAPINRGFATGWDYALSWLIILPFEIVAAGITIEFWRDDIHIGVWVAVFLTILCAVQIFGVRGYGEGAYYRRLPISRYVLKQC